MEPLFAPLDRVYLNAAGRSPLPLPSLAAGLAAAQRKAHSPWDIGDTSSDLDTVRALFASLIGASAEDICITPSCSYAMSLAAHNLRHRISAQRRGVLVLAECRVVGVALAARHRQIGHEAPALRVLVDIPRRHAAQLVHVPALVGP